MTIEELETLHVVNLTPAEITIIARSGTFRFPYSDNHATIESGKIAGLPDAEDGVAYLVSNAVASRVDPERDDIFAPYRMSYFYRSAANLRSSGKFVHGIVRVWCLPPLRYALTEDEWKAHRFGNDAINKANSVYREMGADMLEIDIRKDFGDYCTELLLAEVFRFPNQ